jgi:RNA polymerase sigma-70 factor (ECF subfamily)
MELKEIYMGLHKKEYIMLVQESKEMLYRIAYGYLGNETLALDAVDEAVYLGYIHRKKIRNPEFSKTWLTRILINECFRLLKRQKREFITETFPELVSDDTFESIPLKEAIQTLQDDLKKVILLRYFGGYTIAETAVILNIPEGTVATWTKKALSLLKIELDD